MKVRTAARKRQLLAYDSPVANRAHGLQAGHGVDFHHCQAATLSKKYNRDTRKCSVDLPLILPIVKACELQLHMPLLNVPTSIATETCFQMIVKKLLDRGRGLGAVVVNECLPQKQKDQ